MGAGGAVGSGGCEPRIEVIVNLIKVGGGGGGMGVNKKLEFS